jgi:flavorubredoxin
VRDFHGYITQNGTTYNNYLINDEQATLIDTVKHDFEMLTIENIRSIVDPSLIKNVVVNHIEPDHASALGTVMKYMP